MSHVSFQKQNLAERVADRLSQEIGRQGWSTGRKLPAVRDLARQFDVSPNTAHSAVQLLARRGVVELQPRQGAFVERCPVSDAQTPTSRNQIGVVWACAPGEGFDSSHDDWTGRIVRAAELELFSAGYYATALGYFGADEFHGRIEPMLPHLGGVLTFARAGIESVLDSLDESRIPWVTINRVAGRNPGSFVTSTNQADCADFGRAVAKVGIRRVWILTSTRAQGSSTMDKLLGFFEGFLEAGAPTDRIEVLDCESYLEAAGYKTVMARLGRSRRPQLIFATGDMMALGALRACRQRNIRVPDEVGVVGSTGLKMAELSHPSLSVVTQPMDEMGRQAAQMLVQMARGEVSRLPGRFIAGQYIQRQSFKLVETVSSSSDPSSFSRSQS